MNLPVGAIAAALGLAALGSLFSAGDTALVSLPAARLEFLAHARDGGFARYAKDKLGLHASWRVARVVSLSVSYILVYRAMDSEVGSVAASVGAVASAALVYAVLSESLGTIARQRPEAVGRLALALLRPFEWAVAPVAAPLGLIGKWVERAIPEKPRALDARHAESEVEWLVDQSEKAGSIEKEPATMIRNVLDFRSLTAKEVMIPRRRVSALEATTPLNVVLEHVRKDGHSRYPVYRESIDNVVGLLYVKDLFDVVATPAIESQTLESVARKSVLFITESQSALSVLREMRSKRLHLAIVSDEFGGTGGIVTLEDIIEEIVGEIHDEYDTEEVTAVLPAGEGRFLADAAIALSDLEDRLGTALPEGREFESLGGLIVHRAGRVPDVGAVVSLDGYELIVREADETRVITVEIVRSAAEGRSTTPAAPADPGGVAP